MLRYWEREPVAEIWPRLRHGLGDVNKLEPGLGTVGGTFFLSLLKLILGRADTICISVQSIDVTSVSSPTSGDLANL